jgi:hypothetical protein
MSAMAAARLVVDQIMEAGEIRRGSLGITIDDPTPDVIRELKISAPPNGAVIVKGRSAITRGPRWPEIR